jgi:flagellar assembly protein FliH
VLDLALVLARQLVGQALEVRRELVRPIVAAALAQLPQSTQRIELRLHPADVALVEPIVAEPHGGARLTVVADPLVAPGGCEIETEQCSVDATMPTRWRQLLANLGRTDDWLEPL